MHREQQFSNHMRAAHAGKNAGEVVPAASCFSFKPPFSSLNSPLKIESPPLPSPWGMAMHNCEQFATVMLVAAVCLSWRTFDNVTSLAAEAFDDAVEAHTLNAGSRGASTSQAGH